MHQPRSFGNKLLAALPANEAEMLTPHLQPIEFNVRTYFFWPNQPIKSVTFVESGFVSVVAKTPSGHSLEVGIIGREGMVGVPVILGQFRSPHESYAQVAGHGYQMSAEVLWTAMRKDWSLADTLLKFAYAFLVQITHSALANGRFTIEQRLARWLLMAHDRVDGDDVQLTHEFLSMMLGVRRPSVTTVLQMLESHQAIRATRGSIKIQDRRKLEEIAGGCYGVPESELAHVGLN